MEREAIIGRVMSLVGDDPNAEGIIGTFATTIIGAGLKPVPELDAAALGISTEEARKIEAIQKNIYATWMPDADVGERWTDGEIQHLKARSLFGRGDSFEIIYMRKDGPGKFSMATQVIDPLRVKTPTDMRSNQNIKSGIKIGKHGQPVSYFVKKAGQGLSPGADTSKNFVEISARRGHRWSMLHDFIAKDPEQVRGYPILSPAVRFFRDLADLIGAELTSSVVTAAMSVFVEDETDPAALAGDLLSTDRRGAKDERHQDLNPGEIWYGSAGQKPHLLAADRPGTTFEPFTKLVKKSIAMSTGVPYAVLFKDTDGINFAGFRAAMLEAWRVYDYHRKRIGQKDCQKKYTMLMEEAWLRGLLPIGDDFQDNRVAYTRASWYGAPKGDIEPFKAIQADIMKNKAGIKTKEKIIIEDGGPGFTEVTRQIGEENTASKALGVSLDPKPDPKEGAND
jgi:lambda family phage portal protein